MSGWVECSHYCRHGGHCALPGGHDGRHSTGACQWADAESIPQADADRMFADRVNASPDPYVRATSRMLFGELFPAPDPEADSLRDR